jgi:helicase MOV-10
LEYGSPGTGKTVTIVEAMQQLLIRSPGVRILACAPSNSAADLIAQKLIVLGSSQLLRLNSLSRKFDDLPKTLLPFSQVNENKVFVIPPREDLENFRVVVSTCISGGIPQGLGLKRGHFTHIFIDEAGQAKEPEVMVSIKSIAGLLTNVILAGDNQQLGPVVHSRLARDLGLKLSYLDRIMGLEIYDLEKFSGVTWVLLSFLSLKTSSFQNSALCPEL